jgi:hypothetical protein
MRAAIYARVSTTDQNCEMQLAELREYVTRALLMGVLRIFGPLPAPWPPVPGVHVSGNHDLPAVRYLDVLNHHRLFPAPPQLLKREKSDLEYFLHHDSNRR